MMGSISIEILPVVEGGKESYAASWDNVALIQGVRACGAYIGRHMARDAQTVFDRVGSHAELAGYITWLMSGLHDAIMSSYKNALQEQSSALTEGVSA